VSIIGGDADGVATIHPRGSFMSMIYEWKSDSRFPIGAQIAAERLQSIRARNGELTPRGVVDDASNPRSPLHPCFEWDDQKAADSHRMWQARKLIGSIVVAEYDDQPIAKETRAFVHVSSDEPQYVPIEVAMATESIRDEVLNRARREIKMWRARYAAYEEFAHLVAAIDEVI
jgi:hypothetical protein